MLKTQLNTLHCANKNKKGGAPINRNALVLTTTLL